VNYTQLYHDAFPRLRPEIKKFPNVRVVGRFTSRNPYTTSRFLAIGGITCEGFNDLHGDRGATAEYLKNVRWPVLFDFTANVCQHEFFLRGLVAVKENVREGAVFCRFDSVSQAEAAFAHAQAVLPLLAPGIFVQFVSAKDFLCRVDSSMLSLGDNEGQILVTMRSSHKVNFAFYERLFTSFARVQAFDLEFFNEHGPGGPVMLEYRVEFDSVQAGDRFVARYDGTTVAVSTP